MVPEPQYGTPFVGRGPLLQRLLAMPPGLITLTGPAGVGKTRLALEALDRLGASGGFVSLLHVEPTHLPEAVAAGVGGSLAAWSGRWLILDDADLLVDELAAAVPGWLARRPDLHLVVTSRSPLDVGGEQVVQVPPLEVPAAGGEGPSEAAELFVAVAPPSRRPLLAEHRSEVAAVLRRLDGLPLAIELAAARLEVVTLDGLLERLDRRFDVLRDATGRNEPRHRSLRAAIGWSLELLDPAERRALARCAAFRGGFDLPAAEEVLADPDLPGLDAVHALVHASLVQVEPDEHGEPDRFRLLEPIRAVALEQMEALGLRGEAWARHADWYARLGEQPGSRAPAPGVMPRLVREIPNLIAVVERAGRIGDDPWAARAVRVASKLGTAMMAAGRPEHLIRLARSAVALGDAHDVERRDLAEALRALSNAYSVVERLEPSTEAARRVLRIGEELDDPELQAYAHFQIAQNVVWTPDLDAARRHYQAAASLAPPSGRAMSLCAQALHCDLAQGREEQAVALLHEALEALEGQGETPRRGMVLGYLGHLRLEQGQLDLAEQRFEQALAVHRRLDNRRFLHDALTGLGTVDWLRGDRASARARWLEARELAEELADTNSLAGLDTLGAVDALLQGRLAQARRCIDRAAERSPPDPRYAGRMLTVQALVCACEARPEAATALLDEALGLLRRSGREADLDQVRPAAGLVAVRRAASALRRADQEAAGALADEAAEHLEAVRRSASSNTRMLAPILEGALDALPDPAGAWRVARDGAWFEPPGAPPVDLSGRPTLRRVLAALVEAVEEGGALDREALFAAGWPDQHVLDTAAANRVYVAVSTLRRLGLDVLETTQAGWRLAPSCCVPCSGPPSGEG